MSQQLLNRLQLYLLMHLIHGILMIMTFRLIIILSYNLKVQLATQKINKTSKRHFDGRPTFENFCNRSVLNTLNLFIQLNLIYRKIRISNLDGHALIHYRVYEDIDLKQFSQINISNLTILSNGRISKLAILCFQHYRF